MKDQSSKLEKFLLKRIVCGIIHNSHHHSLFAECRMNDISFDIFGLTAGETTPETRSSTFDLTTQRGGWGLGNKRQVEVINKLLFSFTYYL
jgi:hypothetical protein